MKKQAKRDARSATSILHSEFLILHSAAKTAESVERTCKPNSVSACAARIIHLPLALPRWSSNLPESSSGNGRSLASLFGLAPQGVCHAVAAHAGRGALLPHRFTLTSVRLRVRIGGLFSVALSVASPRLAVSQPAARRSSDFPRRYRRDPPVRSTQSRITDSPSENCAGK